MTASRDDRLGAWLAGDRGQGLKRDIARDLAEDADFAARAGELLVIERLLGRATQADDDEGAFAREVGRQLDAPDSGRRFAQAVHRRIFLPRSMLRAAALVMIGLLAATMWTWHQRGNADADADADESTIAILRPGTARCELSSGTSPGDWIVVAGVRTLHRRDNLRVTDSPADISYADGTVLTLLPGTEVGVDDLSGAKNVRIASGSLSAEVAKQPSDRPLVLTTPHARVEVVGTRFTLAVTARDSTLAVSDGAVRLITGIGTTLVARGGSARADSEGAFVMRTEAAGGPVEAGTEVVRRFDIAAGATPSQWSQGRVVAKPDGSGGNCLASDVDEAISPGMMAACAVDWRSGLFRHAADDQLQFDMRTPPGAERLIVWFYDSTSDRGFYAIIPTPGASTWSRATLRLSAFAADDRRPEGIRPGDLLSFLRFSVEPKPSEPFHLDQVRIVRIPPPNSAPP